MNEYKKNISYFQRVKDWFSFGKNYKNQDTNQKSLKNTTLPHLKNLYKSLERTDYYEPKFDRLDKNVSVARDGLSLLQSARYHEANNLIVAAILNRFEDVLVGESGITVEPTPIKKDGTVDYDLATKLRHKWREFCTAPLVNDKGKDFRGVLCYIVRAWLRDGDVFVHMISKEKPNTFGEVEFKIRIIEADYLGYGTGYNYNFNSMVQPIELDEYQRPTYYNFTFTNNLNKFGPTEYVRISEKEILTIANKTTSSQLRGVSIFASVLDDISNIMLYLETNLISARLGTQILGDLSSVGLGDDNTDTSIDINELNTNVHILNIPHGKKLTMHNPVKTDNNLGDYLDTYLRLICSAVGIDYEGVSRLYEGSFSSARMSVINSQIRARGYSEQLISSIVRPLYRKFVEFMIFNDPDFSDIDYKKDYESVFNANYQTPKLPNVDPLKEANANLVMLKSGQISPQALAKRNGYNFEELVMEWKQCEDTLKHHGFNIELNPLASIIDGTAENNSGNDSFDDQDDNNNKSNSSNADDNNNQNDSSQQTIKRSKRAMQRPKRNKNKG